MRRRWSDGGGVVEVGVMRFCGRVVCSRGWVGFHVVVFVCVCRLAGGFGVYHVYLVWAGSTTNEQGKWGDWKEDVLDGLVLEGEGGGCEGIRVAEGGFAAHDEIPDARGAVGKAEWWYIRTRGGEQPMRRREGLMKDGRG